jgi:hypothetical protein
MLLFLLLLLSCPAKVAGVVQHLLQKIVIVAEQNHTSPP